MRTRNSRWTSPPTWPTRWTPPRKSPRTREAAASMRRFPTTLPRRWRALPPTSRPHCCRMKLQAPRKGVTHPRNSPGPVKMMRPWTPRRRRKALCCWHARTSPPRRTRNLCQPHPRPRPRDVEGPCLRPAHRTPPTTPGPTSNPATCAWNTPRQGPMQNWGPPRVVGKFKHDRVPGEPNFVPGHPELSVCLPGGGRPTCTR